MYPPQPDVVHSYLLVFTAQDNYSSRLESALVLLDIGGGKWRLLITHRDAHYPKFEFRKWLLQLPPLDGPEIPGSRDFATLPSAADVDAFIQDAGWSFQPSNGCHFTRAAIYSDTWRQILGYSPRYEIAKPAA
jgi:hypothetical protein